MCDPDNGIAERFDKMNNNMEIRREAIIEIVGTQYEGRAVNHQHLSILQELILKHQSDNPYDQNAVLLLTADRKELGFLPKGYASLYAPAIDSGRYSFTVEILKTEPDPERPILIVKITSEQKKHSEEEIETAVLSFVNAIIDCYEKNSSEYHSFIISEEVDIDKVLLSLNKVRFVFKLQSCIDDTIQKLAVDHNRFQCSSLNRECLIERLYSCLNCIFVNCAIGEHLINDSSLEANNILFDYIQKMKLDVIEVLKTIQQSYNESFDIDDEDEYHRVQKVIREKRKKFRKYDDLLTSLLDAITSFISVHTQSHSSSSEVCNTEPAKTVYVSETVSAPDTVESISTESTTPEPDSPMPDNSKFTEQAFFDWLISEDGVSNSTAKQYISNIHSIEKLYQTLWGVRKNILGAESADNVKSMLETLIQRSEYIEANERRHNSFSISLGKYSQFANISVTGLKSATEKENNKSSISSQCFSQFSIESNPESKNENDNVKEKLSSDYSLPSSPVTDDEKGISFIGLKDSTSTQEVIQSEKTNTCIEITPVTASYTPDTSKPFVLKDAVIDILLTDASEINKYHEYKDGISSKNLRDLIKVYYGRTIGLFEISKLLMLDKTFQSVGKGCYIVNKTAIPYKEPVTIEKIDTLKTTTEQVPIPAPFVTYEESIAAVPVNALTDTYSTVTHMIGPQFDDAVDSNKELTIDSIIEVIKDNYDNLQYVDGFGAYEVKALLLHKGYTNVSEDEIEALMSECPELQEIEDGYYVLASGNDEEGTAYESIAIVDNKPEIKAAEPAIPDAVSEQSQEVPADAMRIVLKLNGNVINVYDCSDALNKVCEFAINCRPFMMARITGQAIQIHGNSAFFRKAVPEDGYNKLSNGLQIITITTLSDLQTITTAIKKYCQIDDSLIKIITE